MEDEEFQEFCIFDAIANGASTLQNITKNCGGLYPVELKEKLEKLVEEKKLLKNTDQSYKLNIEWRIKNPESQPSEKSPYDHLTLPFPHPHDFDWRYEEKTSSKITKMIFELTPKDGSTLLLGAPTVFVDSIKSGYSGNVILLDISSELVDYLENFDLPETHHAVQHDLLSGKRWSADKIVDTVLCDPPWYPEFFAIFLIQASFSVRVGGHIFFSILPINNRPEAYKDRAKMFEIANELGLHLVSLQNNFLNYQTSSFESSSLKNSDIDFTGNWRYGDLLIFRKVFHPTEYKFEELIKDVISNRVEEYSEWKEFLLGKYKIKIKGPFTDFSTDPELKKIEENNILPTVSRRYPGRNKIDLWLWDNRVFGIQGKPYFLSALRKMKKNPKIELANSKSKKALDIIQSLLPEEI